MGDLRGSFTSIIDEESVLSGAYKPITRAPRITKLTKNFIRRAGDKIQFAAACLLESFFSL